MISDDRFEATLAESLADLAPMREPDRLVPEILRAARRERRWPRWLALIKEPPMRTSSRLAVGSPMARIAVLAILLLILSLLTAGSVVVGASLLASPAPSRLGVVANGLIAYDAGGDIWVVNPDGTDPRQLTSGPAIDHAATWSRDGTLLAYWTAGDANSPETLVIVDADGSHPRTITTQRVRTSDLVAGRDLDWSPDGRHVAYSLCTLEEPACDERVFVAATDGSGESQVGDQSLTAWRPRWSPDGSLLAFAASRAGLDQGVYLMNPDGTDVRRLSAVVDDDPSGYGFFSVAWSPAGDSIATRAQGSIWVMPSSVHEATAEIAIAPPDSVVPFWSPDGSWIAYADPTNSVLRVVPAAGGEPASLGSAPQGSGFTWSPDGGSIVLKRCYSGGCGFDVVDAVTGEHLAGIQASDPGMYPSWQQIPR